MFIRLESLRQGFRGQRAKSDHIKEIAFINVWLWIMKIEGNLQTAIDNQRLRGKRKNPKDDGLVENVIKNNKELQKLGRKLDVQITANT